MLQREVHRFSRFTSLLHPTRSLMPFQKTRRTTGCSHAPVAAGSGYIVSGDNGIRMMRVADFMQLVSP
jgi:hypothetical protein